MKAFLAGKRGICPECDARFVVPTESGAPATVFEEPPTEMTETVEPPLAVAAPPVAAPPLPEPEPMPQEVWYVRPPHSVEQYGPADTETFRGWAGRGSRIASELGVAHRLARLEERARSANATRN